MENKEIEQALDRVLNDEYDFPHDFYGEDKATAWERDVDALISYIEQLELENKMLKDKATPKEAIWEYDDEIIFCSCPNCAEILPK